MHGKRFTLSDLSKTPAARFNQHLLGEQPKPEKRAKYGNNKVEWNGELFDSVKELKVYKDLLLRMKAGEIGQIRRQVKYLLVEAVREKVTVIGKIGKRGKPLKRTKIKTIERKMEYWADFVYLVTTTGATVVEDVKSEMTRRLPAYIQKRKLMLSVHGIQIKEV